MEAYYIIGLAGSILVTIAYVPQTLKTVLTKHTKDLSLAWLLILAVGLFMYSAYGIWISSIPVIFSSGFGFILVFILLIYKLRYG
ncbi:MAG: PQ-loop domain-containing transporter [Candidatus Marsarchaeota archaeon]|nr:PQ-loop domain-containing transporter [Candidatus Marsarchaeota archaeon]